MINRIQRAAGALLIVAGVLILAGVGISVVDPGGDDTTQSALSTTTSSTSGSSTSEPSTTNEPSTTLTEAPPTTAAAVDETTSTTASTGSGLGTSGPGSAGETPIANTGGSVLIGPLALALLVIGALTRRLRHSIS